MVYDVLFNSCLLLLPLCVCVCVCVRVYVCTCVWWESEGSLFHGVALGVLTSL